MVAKAMQGVTCLFLALILLAACDNSYHGRLGLLPSHNVPTLSADSLAATLVQEPALLLLDVRSAEEQAISKLAGAVLVDPETFSPRQLDTLAHDHPIVLYCTVGYRSGDLGDRLQAEGFSRVSNLYGGLLEWKNRGHGVVGPSGSPTEQVHTYSGYWADYLEKGQAVY